MRARIANQIPVARPFVGSPSSAGRPAAAWRLTQKLRAAFVALTVLGLGAIAAAQTATTAMLSVGPNPALIGQNVTLSASVKGSMPSGSVTFRDGTTVLGTATLATRDPAWANVALLLRFDASEGAQVFSDYSSYRRTHAATTLTHDGTTFKYGTGSGHWSADGRFLQYPMAPEFQFGAGDFTIETWANFTRTGDRIYYYGDSNYNGGGGQVAMGRDTSNRNIVYLVDASGNSRVITGSVIPANTWVHIAVSRSGSTVRLFLNGVLDSSLTLPAGTALQTPLGRPTVGRLGDYASSYGGAYGTYMVGRLDEFRITKGVARYVAAFTPADAPFASGDESTASYATNALAAGSHSLTFTYGGDANNAASTSNTVTEVISLPPTTTALSVSPNSATFGQSVTLSATVSGNNLNGSVTFSDGGTPLATVVLNAGQASFATSALGVGYHVLSASYGSDPANAVSTSGNVGLQVSEPPPVQAVPLPAPPVSPALVTDYEYDAEGNPTKTIVAPSTRAYATRHEYDGLGRRKNTTDARNGQVKLGYDLQDQLTSVTDPRQLVTQYQPNGLGDMKALISPDTGTTSNTGFDAAGNLKASTDARGVLASYTYDKLNRPKQVVYSKAGSPSRTLNWTYDQTGASFGYGVGRLTTAATPDASTAFRYDALGRVTTTVQTGAVGNALTVGFDYDAAGHVTQLTYPSGRTVSFDWVNGRPQAVRITAGTTTKTLLDQVAMSPFGPVQSWVWQFGAAQKPHARVFDSSGRLVRQALGNLVRDIRYDDAGRISGYTHYDAATGLAAAAYDQGFSYDELGRLQLVTASTNWGYGYDASGNRTASSAGASARGYTISATSNWLDALTNPVRNIGYDLAGSTQSDVQSGSSANFTGSYSLEGRLAGMAQGSSAGVDFGYDALGRRVTRGQWTGSPSNPRAVTLFAYDQDHHLLGEYQADGTPVTEYVWFGDTPVAVLKTDPGNPAAVQIYAIHADHLDTPRVILDAQGKVRWRWMGEPFGASPAEEQPTAGLGALQQNLRFPGQQYEPFGGRHYNHFRDYDPSVGRYIQSDPIGLAGGLNTYAYVGGNPLSNVDPAGLACTSVGNRTYCEYPGGPAFDVPRPPDFPARVDDGSFFYHKYDVTRDLNGADARCVMAELRKNATPGKSNGASTNGTVNIAKVGPLDNPVISYVTKDTRTGDRLIVNITFDNGVFADGYVARGVVGNTVHTWGEGTAVKQSPNAAGVLSRAAQYAANELVWGGQMDEIIKKCGCQK